MELKVSKPILIFSILAVLFSGGCSVIKVQMEEYIGKTYNCAASVVDERPDKRIIFSGLYALAGADAIDVVPPLGDIISSKICQNKKVNQYLASGKGLQIHIEDVKTEFIAYAFSVEYIMYVIGYLEENNQNINIRSYGNIKSGSLRKAMPELINNATDDFVLKIEEHLKLSELN